MVSGGVAQEPVSNVEGECTRSGAKHGTSAQSSGAVKPLVGGSSPPPANFDRLVRQLVCWSFMFHGRDATLMDDEQKKRLTKWVDAPMMLGIDVVAM